MCVTLRHWMANILLIVAAIVELVALHHFKKSPNNPLAKLKKNKKKQRLTYLAETLLFITTQTG